MVPINHLRNRVDQLKFRADHATDSMDRMRLVQECSELERSIQVHEDQLRREMSELDSARSQLQRYGRGCSSASQPFAVPIQA